MITQSVQTPRLATGTPAKASEEASFFINRRNRFWEVVDASGTLVCMTVYKRGAKEVVRRLATCRCGDRSA